MSTFVSMDRMDVQYPLLSKIDSPADVKKLELNQLPDLCQEIRAYMLDILSQTPGHLAAGLGVVELTVALHYVFDTPEDKLVWDVGHQSYPHKILTGRRDSFSTLRHWGGAIGLYTSIGKPIRLFRVGPCVQLHFGGTWLGCKQPP